MIAYLKGKLTHAESESVIVEVGGVGYFVSIPSSLFAHLPELGSEILLFTSLIVRETAQMLFGFLSTKEKGLFEKFIGVSGIGPKLALSLLSHLPLGQLKEAIETKNIAVLCQIPGIGKKSAERIALELRDSIKDFLPQESLPPAPSAVSLASQKIQDAMSALVRLGYNQNTAQNALKKTLAEQSDEREIAELITAALKHV